MRTNGQEYLSIKMRSRHSSVMSRAGDKGLSTDIINFSLGDPDLTTDRLIIDSCYRDMIAGQTHYTETLGQKDLREAIIEFTQRDYGLSYHIDECMVTTSANHGMWLLCQALFNPDDEVIIFEPYFTPYLSQISMSGARSVSVATSLENDFLPVRSDIEAALTKKTRALIVNSPTNPTGAVWDKKTLEMIADIARQHHLLVLADDIYTIYDYERPFCSISTLPHMQERTIVIRSFSKNYCMAGFRIGYLLGPAEVMAACRDINEGIVFVPPTPSQRAALSAISHHDDICPHIRQIFHDRLNRAYHEVCQTPGMKCQKVRGSIYLWIDIRETGLSSKEFAEVLFKQAHVAIVPGNAFGASGEGFIRLAATVDEKLIQKAFERIRSRCVFS